MTKLSWADDYVGNIIDALKATPSSNARAVKSLPACSIKSDYFVLCNDEIIGVRLKAAKDLKCGDIVLQERPVLCAPEESSRAHMWCTLCYRPLYNDGLPACSSGHCRNRFCSKDCAAKGKAVHDAECPVLRVVSKAWRELSEKARAVVARGLALRLAGESGDKAAAAAYKSLMALEAHLELARSCDTCFSTWTAGATRCKHALQAIGVETSVEELMTIHLLHRVNGMRLAPRGDSCDGHGGLVVIFPHVSRLEHNCNPTCVYEDEANLFAASPEHCAPASVTIRVVRPVEKDEPLSIGYCRLDMPHTRRQSVCLEKYFRCECYRCQQELACPGFFCMGSADESYISAYEKASTIDAARKVYRECNSEHPADNYLHTLAGGRLIDLLLESLPPLVPFLGLDGRSRRACLGPYLQSSSAKAVAKEALDVSTQAVRSIAALPKACSPRSAALHFRMAQAALLNHKHDIASTALRRAAEMAVIAYGHARGDMLLEALSWIR